MKQPSRHFVFLIEGHDVEFCTRVTTDSAHAPLLNYGSGSTDDQHVDATHAAWALLDRLVPATCVSSIVSASDCAKPTTYNMHVTCHYMPPSSAPSTGAICTNECSDIPAQMNALIYPLTCRRFRSRESAYMVHAEYPPRTFHVTYKRAFLTCILTCFLVRSHCLSDHIV
jgi:hypothetical protein